MLKVVMLKIVMEKVVMVKVVMLKAAMLHVTKNPLMISVVMLGVAAPIFYPYTVNLFDMISMSSGQKLQRQKKKIIEQTGNKIWPLIKHR